ncbi:helix-turn-helix domain-containing protein [Streptomyces flaveus]|uniref:helix-turn-helix domain-containing protein n=1 Tax=Streptomyces flaveus TaxID=66370 RepID=UPI004032F3ED
MARELGRDPAMISREVRRNRDPASTTRSRPSGEPPYAAPAPEVGASMTIVLGRNVREADQLP